jgi:hypothetical protein
VGGRGARRHLGRPLAGPAALRDLRARGSTLVTFDSFWRLFYPPFGYTSAPAGLTTTAALCCLALAVVLAVRLPPGRPGLAAVRPAVAVSMAWLFVWPLQRAWYDTLLFALLALFPATRLDWLVLLRSVPVTLDLVAGVIPRAPGPHWLHWMTGRLGHVLAPDTRLAAVIALAALCATAAWNPRPGKAWPGTAGPGRAMISPAEFTAKASGRYGPRADGMAGSGRLLAHHAARPPGARRPEDQQGNGLQR